MEAYKERDAMGRERFVMKAVEEPVCQYPGCDNCGTVCCDHCDRYFCPDHGTRGGDRQVQDVGPVAYPSACWDCGGFNADEGSESDIEERRRRN
jgi:hypothetical protein